MKRYLLFILIIFLHSCNTYSPSNSQTNLPSWYISPQQNDSVNLYGVGEGFTLEEATKSALSNLSSKLMTSISAESSILMEENNYGINEEFRKKITEKIEKMTFTNYKVSNSSSKGIRFYAEITVDRADFISDRKSKLAELNQKMADIYTNSQGKTILEKRNSLEKVVNTSLEAKSIIYVVTGLGVNVNKQENINKYNAYQRSYDKTLGEIEFFINLQDDTPESVKAVIASALNKRQLKIAKRKNSNNKNLVTINITSDIVSNNIYGSNIVKLKVNFSLISNENKGLASNLIEVTGSSTIGEGEAINAAIYRLDKEIGKKGILTILGINNDE